jgi:hypothetical protein
MPGATDEHDDFETPHTGLSRTAMPSSHRRHTFGTHAALFGVNPWRLQSWMGHKRIDETMLYVHVAENHRRDLPAVVGDRGGAGRVGSGPPDPQDAAP